MNRVAIIAGILMLSAASPGLSHEPSQALLWLSVEGSDFRGRWNIALADLDEAVGLDVDGNRELTWGEFTARRNALLDHLDQRLTFRTAETCPLNLSQRLLERVGGVSYAVIDLHAKCASPLDVLQIDYRFLADIDPGHRAIVEIRANGNASTLIIKNTDPATIGIDEVGNARQATGFVVEGMLHIWQGYDHLAFLALLLLPAVLGSVRRNAAGIVWPIIKIVTAFTVAHSLTLGLAALEWVSVPARPVEIAIAASIVLAAFLSLIPRVPEVGPGLAFGFGLLHGLGFANALSGLNSAGSLRLLNLAGFNLGVELGQIAIVALIVPILYVIGKQASLRNPLRLAACSIIGLVGVYWLVERAGW